MSLECVMQFQIQPVLLIGTALQRTGRENDDHIPALIHYSEEFFIELTRAQGFDIQKYAVSP